MPQVCPLKKKRKEKIFFQSEEFPLWLSMLRTQHCLYEMWVWSQALFCGLRIWHYHKLQHRSHMELGSGVAIAMAQACICSSNSAPNLGTSFHMLQVRQTDTETERKGKKKNFSLRLLELLDAKHRYREDWLNTCWKKIFM